MALLQELQESYSSYVEEARELVCEYEFILKNKEAPALRIKVWKDVTGDYHGSVSHFVQLPGAHTPYKPSHSRATTVTDAINEVFYGLMGLTEDKEGCSWVKNEYY